MARVAEATAAAAAAGAAVGARRLPPTMALLQLPEANACLVAYLLSSRDQIQSVRKGDLHPGKALAALWEQHSASEALPKL